MDYVPSILQWVGSILTIITGHDTQVMIGERDLKFSSCEVEIILALAMQTFQVARRFFECLYISVFSDSQMHLLHYVVGYFFYTWTGPTILSQFATCTQTKQCFFSDSLSLTGGNMDSVVGFQLRWYHLCGLLLFGYASYHQYKCHVILANIRTGHGSNVPQYSLPKGDWFDLVTSPHYFAEILLYFGISMVQGFRNVWTITPVLSTTLLLLIGATLSHEWYTEKYGSYVQRRHALIPYIY